MSPTQNSLSVALDADDGIRISREVALAMTDRTRPIPAFRNHQRLALQELSERTGLAVSYLSGIKRGIKRGAASTLSRIARALGTTVDVLVAE